MAGEYLSQLSAGYAPLVTGRTPSYITGMEGLPLFSNGGMTGIAANMFLGPSLNQYMAGHGMAPFGVGHDQNLYDLIRKQQFIASQQRLVQEMAPLDTPGHMETFRGLAAVTGTPWGLQQRRAARSLAGAAVRYSPMLTEFAPEFVDQMGGMQGSAAVMARHMSLGSRYRVDPVTGMMGMAYDSTRAMTESLFQDMYRTGDITQMRGITAGQMGGMYDELTRRGMLGGTLAPLSSRTMDVLGGMDRRHLERIATDRGVSLPANLTDLRADDLDKLRLDSGIASKLRSVDIERTKTNLKSYVEAISAIRDIFGDAGKPNAPMSELIRGLEAMTQGGMNQIDPQRLNMIVRTTHELAKQSGMAIDAAMAMQQHAASKAIEFGASPLQAVQIAQGSMAWGAAFRGLGGSAQSAWGRFNSDQMQQLDVNLRAQATSSEQTNRMAALMTLRDTVGGFKEGTTAAAMAKAIATGQTEFFDPMTNRMRSTMMSGNQFQSILLGATDANGNALNLTEGQIVSLLENRSTNAAAANRYGITDQTRIQQAQEAQGFVAQQIRSTLRDRLRGVGISDAEATRIASSQAGNIAGQIAQLSNADFANDQTRTAKISDILASALEGTAGANLGKPFMATTAGLIYGDVTRAIELGPLRGLVNYQNLHAVMHPEVLQQSMRNRLQASLAGELSDALSPFKKGTILQNAIQALREAGPDADVTKILMSSFGGVKIGDVNEALIAPMTALRDMERQAQAMHQQVMNAPDGESRSRALAKLEDHMRVFRSQVSKVADVGKRLGIYQDKNQITSADVSEAYDSHQRLRTQMQSLFGITTGRSDFSAALETELAATKDDVAAVLKLNPGMSYEAAMAEATALKRAAYLGIDGERLKNASMPGDTTMDALDRILQAQRREFNKVTEDDRKAYRKRMNYSADDLSREELDRRVLAERYQQQKRHMGNFWHSDAGADFRLAVTDAMDSAEDLASKAVLSEADLSKLGPRAIEHYQRIKANRQRLAQLALYHSDKDLARLMASDINVKDPVEREKVLNEVRDITRSMGASTSWFREHAGRLDMDWGDDDERSARHLLGYDLNNDRSLSNEQYQTMINKAYQVRIAKQLNPSDRANLSRYNTLYGTLKAQAEKDGVRTEDLVSFLTRQTIAPPGKYGWFKDDEKLRNRLTNEAAEFSGLRAALLNRAREMNLRGGITDLNRGNEVHAELQKLAGHFVRLEKRDPVDDVRALYKSMGVDADETQIAKAATSMDPDSQMLARLMVGSVDQMREIASRAYKIRQNLASKASGADRTMLEGHARSLLGDDGDVLAGVRALHREYSQVQSIPNAQTRKKALDQFRRDSGLESARDFNTFIHSLPLLNTTGLLKKPGAGQSREEIIERAILDLQSSTPRDSAQPTAATGGMPSELKLTGSLTLHQPDRAEISSTAEVVRLPVS